MTKRKLWQLLWRHYRTLLLTAGGVLLLVGIKEGYSIAHNPSRYVAQNVSSFALMEATHLRMETVVAIIVSLVLGVALFLSDNFTNFNQYLFSFPVARKQIYRRKIGLLIGMLVSAYMLAEAVFGLIAWRVLAKQQVRIDWLTTLYEELGILAVMLVFGLLAATFGLWVGHIFASALATFVFVCSLPFAYDGLINLAAGLTKLNYEQVDVLGQLPSWKPGGLLTTWVICGVIGGGLYLLNRWAFEHLSLENSGDFFRFPQWRGAVLGFSIIYLIVAICCSQFGNGVLGLLTDNYHAHMPLSTGIIMALVVAYLTWSLGRWFLYRPDRFRDAWTVKKLA